MTADVDLWRPSWDIEPCDTATPAPPTRRGNPYAGLAAADDPRAYRRIHTVGSVDDYQPQGDPP